MLYLEAIPAQLEKIIYISIIQMELSPQSFRYAEYKLIDDNT